MVLSAKAYKQLAPDLAGRKCICVSSKVGRVTQGPDVYWAPHPLAALEMAELFTEQGLTHGSPVVLGGASILQSIGHLCDDWIFEEHPTGSGANADILLSLEGADLVDICTHDFDDVKIHIRKVRL